MARREVFPADTPMATFRQWLAKATAEVFHTPRRLPLVRTAPAEPLPPEPDLFEALQEPEAPRERTRPDPGMPLDRLLLNHFAGAIRPPSALAMKRRERRAERDAQAAVQNTVE